MKYNQRLQLFQRREHIEVNLQQSPLNKLLTQVGEEISSNLPYRQGQWKRDYDQLKRQPNHTYHIDNRGLAKETKKIMRLDNQLDEQKAITQQSISNRHEYTQEGLSKDVLKSNDKHQQMPIHLMPIPTIQKSNAQKSLESLLIDEFRPRMASHNTASDKQHPLPTNYYAKSQSTCTTMKTIQNTKYYSGHHGIESGITKCLRDCQEFSTQNKDLQDQFSQLSQLQQKLKRLLRVKERLHVI